MGGKMTIPCIEEKCLKYPACSRKERIICPALINYYNAESARDHSKLHSNTWTKVREALPEVALIAEEEGEIG